MGANGSYSKKAGGVPLISRTHRSLGIRIDGHKILTYDKQPSLLKIPMNSNSEKPMYLCATVDKKTGKVTVKTIGIYRKHELVASIDLKFDKKGNYVPYKKGDGNSSHLHRYVKFSDGHIGRKSHDNTNTFPVPRKYRSLINKIVKYNKSN